MLTWKRGRELVFQNLQKHAIPLDDFLPSLFIAPPLRVSGTAIFLRGESDGVPHALLHNLLHNKVLHERVVFLTVFMHEEPWVAPAERVRVVDAGPRVLPGQCALRLQGRTGHSAGAGAVRRSRAWSSR